MIAEFLMARTWLVILKCEIINQDDTRTQSQYVLPLHRDI